MPRTGRGGARQGVIGQAYSNRSDLNNSMPVQTATGQPYGVAAEQRAAQQAIPVASQPIAPPASPQQTPRPTQQPLVSDQITSPTAPSADNLRFLEPTDFPDEPVTSGIDMGPGVGSDAIFGPTAAVSQDLNALAARANSPILLDLANAASILGI